LVKNPGPARLGGHRTEASQPTMIYSQAERLNDRQILPPETVLNGK
jgi:hypothetical protein